jgi:hypothetical protein
MPRTACISMPEGSRYLYMRKPYVNLCGKNFCAAALLAIFEAKTTSRLYHFKVKVPWFEMPFSEMRDWMFGMYSMRSIQDSVKFLCAKGWLQVRGTGLCNANEYLLDYKKLSILVKDVAFRDDPEDEVVDDSEEPEANDSRWQNCQRDDGRIANETMAELPTTTLLLNPSSLETHLDNSSKQIIPFKDKNAEVFSPPQAPTAPEEIYCDLDEITVDNIAEIFYSEWEVRFGKPRIVFGKEHQCLVDWGVSVKTVGNLRKELNEYAGKPSVSEFLKLRKTGSPGKNRMGQGNAQRGPGSSFSGGVRVSGGYGKKNGYRPSKPQIPPPEALEWNEKVPSAQWRQWDGAVVEQMTEKLGTPEFVADYAVWMQKCVELGKAGEAGSLQSCLKQWVGIVNGNKDWLCKPNGTKPKAGNSRELSNQAMCNSLMEKLGKEQE